MLGLALVVFQGWSFSSWAQPLKNGAKDGKGESRMTSQVEKSGQRDSVPKEGRIVLLGASYVRAWNIQEIAGLKVVNKGVNGNQSFEMLSRFPEDVLALKPQAVLIWGFINDIHRTKKEVIQAATEKAKNSLQEMVRLSKSNGIIPILGTEVTSRRADGFKESLSWYIGNLLGKESYQGYVNKQVMAVNQWIKEYAGKEGIVLLDFQTVLSDAKGFRKKEFAAKDGNHISSEGYEKLTSYVVEKMGKELRK
jgi:lysophospholipase L1-like esterase